MLPAAREREESPRANRSKTSGCSSAGMPGPSSVDGQHGLAGLGRRSAVVTVVPGGVWVRALASRLASTWCSRASSPATVDRLGRQVEAPVVVGAGGVRVADRVDHQHGQVDRRRVQRPAGVQAGEQQQVLDQGGHPGASDSTRRSACATSSGTGSRLRRVSSA